MRFGFRAWLRRPWRKPQGHRLRSVVPSLEMLEERWVPSSSRMPALPGTDTASPAATQTRGQGSAILPNLGNATLVSTSTVPTNGDNNPYGVVFVPPDFQGSGQLAPGDVLVTNFDNATQGQGTGSTIVKISPGGQQSVFFQGPPDLGLSDALGLLPQGFVLVGGAPATTQNGQATVGNGALLILNSNGQQVGQITSPTLLQGPWGLAVNTVGDHSQVFVSNVLSGTVTRIDLTVPNGATPQVVSETQIASGYAHRTDPNALVVGPTGLAFDPRTDTLFVASTGDNAIYAVHNAAFTPLDLGKGQLVTQDPQHLHGPLGLTFDPTNGDLIVANGDAQNPDPNQPNELDEFTRSGRFVGQFQVDPGNPGAAFGVATQVLDGQVRFAAANDNANTLEVWTFPPGTKSAAQR